MLTFTLWEKEDLNVKKQKNKVLHDVRFKLTCLLHEKITWLCVKYICRQKQLIYKIVRNIYVNIYFLKFTSDFKRKRKTLLVMQKTK